MKVNSSRLEEFTTDYISKHLQEVMNTESFKLLSPVTMQGNKNIFIILDL